ncbi:hypothetical protein DFP72DRAFT_1169945 [Ephemerocybe angulata]|uniref:Uncharacterized protein n=1 Tax=Ephemerocybe angulata TaxID=980116 RepID=A0A8H6HZ48_9AGAR|nr:hypothetical protein DFP72DRAFT_1169945 [Tulosesus angulatus]
MEDEQYDQELEAYTQLFDDIFATSDFSSTSLGEVILQNPTISLPTALASSTWAAANIRPTEMEDFLSRIKNVLNDARIQNLVVHGGEDGPERFVDVYDRSLSDIVSDHIHISSDSDEDDTVVDTNSPVLTTVLLQSVAAKLGLVDTDHHIRAARQGLGLEDLEEVGREVLAIAAVVVFAILGARRSATLSALHGGSYEDVVAAFRSLWQGSTSPALTPVLERIIVELERGSNESASSEELWLALFQ